MTSDNTSTTKIIPATLQELRAATIPDAEVIVSFPGSPNTRMLVDRAGQAGKTPFLLQLDMMNHLERDGEVRRLTSGTYHQTCSLLDIMQTTVGAGYDGFHRALSSPGFNLFLASLGVARAESIGASSLSIDPSIVDRARLSRPTIQALERLIEIGTDKETHITLVPEDRTTPGGLSPGYPTDPQRRILLISGGTDSVVAGAIEQSLGAKIELFQVMYDQAARNQEAWCVDHAKEYFTNPGRLTRVHLGILKKFGGSGLLQDNIQITRANAHIEYVPFRNTVFLTLALARAEQAGAAAVILGAHKDDTMAPDGTAEYVAAFNALLETIPGYEPRIKAPLLDLGGKPELITLGLKLGVPFQYTWSCHGHIERGAADAKACGTCGNCRTRYSAFEKIGMKDPVPYETMPDPLRTTWAGPGKDYLPLMKILG